MSYTEWEMMCIDEDIEQGDTVLAEHISDESRTLPMVFCNESEDGLWIHTKDRDGNKYIFSTDSLEQKGKRTKQWRIARKSFPMKLCKVGVTESRLRQA
jgi:hypothetical protein